MKKLSEIWKMQDEKLCKTNETYIREEPTQQEPPASERQRQVEAFASDKSKRTEVIKAFTQIKDHPQAEDMGSDVGSAFDEKDLDEEQKAAFEVIGDGGFIYDQFHDSYWIRHKDKLIRVM